jgi:isocitrate dehydrogenase
MNDLTKKAKEFIPITIAHGDGCGPEIMESILHILMEAKARIRIEVIEVGEKLYAKNYISGISEDTLQSIERTRILLKAPTIKPLDNDNYKDLSDTLKDVMSLYVNMIFLSSYPITSDNKLALNSVIISSNNKQALSETLKFAFEFAAKNNLKKLLCLLEEEQEHDSQILRAHFMEIAEKHQETASSLAISSDFNTKDAALFDIIITTKTYKAKLISNIYEIANLPLIACSADISDYYSLFEVIHDAKAEIANMDLVNPSALIHSANNMLRHIGQQEIASLIETAWRKTIVDGIHTEDIYNQAISTKNVGTKEFTQEIIMRIGQ